MSDNAPEVLDTLVVGGGVNGTGIARDAVGRGLRVGLCEKGDLASATSSWSSKLIHGGLRYLQHYEFKLVRDALKERDVILANGCHITRPLRFILPHDSSQRPTLMIRAGLFLYDHLHRARHFAKSQGLNLQKDAVGRSLKPTYSKGFAYSDGWCDDARLVVLNAIDARERGADIRVRTELVSAEAVEGLWHARLRERATGRESTVKARSLVNAAGPWADEIITGVLQRNAPRRTNLVKGSHIVTERIHDGEEAFILQNPDGRIVFVIPFEGRYSLIGTTDEAVDSPENPTCTDADIDYLCACVNRYFDREIGRDDVVWQFAGVRPLYKDNSDDPSAATRSYVLALESGGDQPALLNIFGGKLTTYRQLSEEAVAKLLTGLGEANPGSWTADAVLPGADIPALDPAAWAAKMHHHYPWLSYHLLLRYVRQFGTRAAQMLGEAAGPADLGHHFGGDLYEREVNYLLTEEFAADADDILWRRTKRGLHMTAEERQGLADWLAAGHGAQAEA